MIEELKWQSRGRTFDMMPVYHAKEDDLDKKKILEFIRTRKSSKVNTISHEVLLSYDLVIEEHSSSYPTVGGMLLFGKESQKFFFEAMILCSHFSAIAEEKPLPASIAPEHCSSNSIERMISLSVGSTVLFRLTARNGKSNSKFPNQRFAKWY